MLQRRCLRSAAQQDRGEDNNHGYDQLFPGVAEALSGADFAIANLEFPVFEREKPSREMVFHGTPPVLRAVKKAGFTVITGANNHAFDHGRISPASTARLCREVGLVCLGVGENREQAERPDLITIKGARIAVVAYSLLANSNLNSKRDDAPRVNGYRFRDLVEQVKAARKISDGVIVTIHWGQEYRTRALRIQRDQARELAAAGAVLIIGSHPHVLEQVETIETADGRQTLVAYSLGNFTSNQGGRSTASTTRLGAIIKVEFQKTERGLEIAAWDSLATWIQNRNTRIGGRAVEDIHVEVVPLRLRDLAAELSNSTDEKEKAALQRQINFYQARARAADAILEQPRGTD